MHSTQAQAYRRATSLLILTVLFGACAGCNGGSPTSPSSTGGVPSPGASAVVSALFDGSSFSATSVARATVSGALVSITGAEGRRGVSFSFIATAPGTYAVQTAAVIDGDQSWGVGLSFGADGSGGTVVVNTLSATRVAGTFQMTVVQPSTRNTRRLTNGRFDVPVQ